MVKRNHTATIMEPNWLSTKLRSIHADDFNFRLQINSAFIFRALFQNRNQFQNVVGRGRAFVHNEIAVLGGNHRPPTRVPFNPSSSINLPAGIGPGF